MEDPELMSSPNPNNEANVPINIPFGEHLLRNIQTTELSDEVIFNQLWSNTLIQHTLEQLEIDYKKKGNKVLFKAIRGSLTGELRVKDYSKIAEKLDMPERTFKTSISRLKQRHRSKLKTLIGDTLLEPEETEEELNYLFSRV